VSERFDIARRNFLALLGGATGAAALTSAVTGRNASLQAAGQTGELARLSHLGRYSVVDDVADDVTVFDEGAAEISSYDEVTGRLFVVNGLVDGIDVLDVSDPTNPQKLGEIATGLNGPNNVTTTTVDGEGVLAAAVEADDTQANGEIQFYDTETYQQLGAVEAGPLPDMVTFAEVGDSLYALSANEGEPSDDYSTDPAGSVSVVDVTDGFSNPTAEVASFTPFDGQEDQLRAQGIRIYGPNASASEDLEPEYIATAGDTAYVTLQENNAVAIVDIENAEVTDLVALGYKDHSLPQNALDAIDEEVETDGTVEEIDITTQPVFGMYQPDAIEAYEVDGESYLVTTNEGDAREYDTLFETGVLTETDAGDFIIEIDDDGESTTDDVIVDESAFDDDVLSALEGLEVTARPPTMGEGDVSDPAPIDELYLYGARSFSIHNSDGDRIFESGSRLERIVAREQPQNFNSDDDENSVGSESVASGPEQEGLAIGLVNGTPYAFIGLEEVSAVVAFDVSDPEVPIFADYINTRDFSVEPENEIEEGDLRADAAGDLSPEGVEYVPAAVSPISDPMLVVCYEVSGTTSFYRVGTGVGRDDPDGEDNEFSVQEVLDVIVDFNSN
jgi:hypothetical protein